MTDARTTQIGVEQFATGNPAVQATQLSVEHWASVATGTVQALLTSITVEQWASVAQISAGGGRAFAVVMA